MANILQVLHPQLKLRYFHKKRWLSEWIDEAERVFRQRFNDRYSQPIETEKEDLLEVDMQSSRGTTPVCTRFSPLCTLTWSPSPKTCSIIF